MVAGFHRFIYQGLHLLAEDVENLQSNLTSHREIELDLRGRVERVRIVLTEREARRQGRFAGGTRDGEVYLLIPAGDLQRSLLAHVADDQFTIRRVTLAQFIPTLTKLGSMLDTVVNTGANAINGISFDVSNKEEAMSTARRNAIDNAKRQAAEIAEAAGVELGEIINVSINNSSSPIPLYDGRGMAQAASDGPISAGQLSIIVEATVTYAIK